MGNWIVAFFSLLLIIPASGAVAGTLTSAQRQRLKSAGYHYLRTLASDGQGLINSPADKEILIVLVRQKKTRKIVALQRLGNRTPLVLLDHVYRNKNVTIRVNAAVGSFFHLPTLAHVKITVVVTGIKARKRVAHRHFVLRRGIKFSIATSYRGDMRNSPGPGCGSGAHDSVHVKLLSSSPNVVIEISQRRRGTFSVKRGAFCVQRSPIRQRPTTRRLTIKP